MNQKPIEKPAAVGPNPEANPNLTLHDKGLSGRLLQRGAETLTDAELLAVCLENNTQDQTAPHDQAQSALERAEVLLENFGNLRQLLWTGNQQRSCEELGKATYVQFKAYAELITRSLRQGLEDGSLFNRHADLCQFLKLTYGGTNYEVLAGFFLDTKYHLIKFEELFLGTLNYIQVYPRDVIQKTLNHNAAFLILAHNHPAPHNESDYLALLETAQQLIDALELINVEVLDYLVVSGGDCVSLKEKGMM